jgi:hypothetical protein
MGLPGRARLARCASMWATGFLSAFMIARRSHPPFGQDRCGLQIAPGPGDPFEPPGDIDAVAHEVAVAFLDDVADVNADQVLYALLGRHAGAALGHSGLHFDRAACVRAPH